MARPKGGYRLADGTRVPGVTTIIGRFKDSGGLLWWAFGQGQAAERGEIESLYDKRDEAADIGTIAHAMVECDIRGVPFDASKHDPVLVDKAETAFLAYLEWRDSSQLQPVETETSLISERHRFGGTLDVILVKGRRCLGDWKTSSGVYPDYLIQLAAYALLWEENRPDEPIDGYHLCRFDKEHGDFTHHFWPELQDAKRAFLLMRELYDLDKTLKKRVK